MPRRRPPATRETYSFQAREGGEATAKGSGKGSGDSGASATGALGATGVSRAAAAGAGTVGWQRSHVGMRFPSEQRISSRMARSSPMWQKNAGERIAVHNAVPCASERLLILIRTALIPAMPPRQVQRDLLSFSVTGDASLEKTSGR